MTSGVVSVLSYAPGRAGPAGAAVTEVASPDGSEAPFEASLERSMTEPGDREAEDESAAEVEEEPDRVEASAPVKAEPARVERQIVRRAQDALAGRDESIAQRVESWEQERTQIHASEAVHTAAGASAAVVEGRGAVTRPAFRGEGESVERRARAPAPGAAVEKASRSARPERVVPDDGAHPAAVHPDDGRAPDASARDAAGRETAVDERARGGAENRAGVGMKAAPAAREAEIVGVSRSRVRDGAAASAGVVSSVRPVGASGRPAAGREEASKRVKEASPAVRGASSETGDRAVSVPGGAERVEAALSLREAGPEGGEGGGDAGDAGEGRVRERTAPDSTAQGRDTDGRLALVVARSATRALGAMLRQRGGVMTIGLRPESLGRLKIRMRISGGCVEVDMATERTGADAALRGSLDELRASLEARGLRVDRLEVRVAGFADLGTGPMFEPVLDTVA